jgi:hypothetical protein
MASSVPPLRRFAVTNATTKKPTHVYVTHRPLVVRLRGGTVLRRVAKGVYEHPVTLIRYGAESDEAP